MYKSTGFLCLLLLSILIILMNIPLSAQGTDTLFYDSFENMDNWTPVGPQGFTSWEMSNTNYAGGINTPEVRFTWVYPFVGESYLLASPVITGMQGHNMELKFNYYEDYWSNIVYVGVAITGDGGTTYNSVWELQASGNSGPELVTVDFTGIDNMQMALYYLGDSNDIDFWYVDDFTLIDLDVVPVELTSFTAQAVNGSVNLNWQTATEINNKGFEIQRSEIRDQKSEWQAIGFIQGNGTATKPHSYSYADNNVKTGTYSYRLKQIDFNGSFEYSKEVNVIVKNVPAEFTLSQNYPNPFNPSTNIDFQISQNVFVSLKVYDEIGNEVATLINERRNGGNYSIKFNASNLTSGIYYYRLTAGNFTSVKKLILLK